MYWSKVIIASLVATPSFARQQRLGGPALEDHVEMVGDGIVFDESPSTQFSSRNLEVDQQDGADAYAVEESSKHDEQDAEKNDEDAAVFETEYFHQADEDGFFDLAPHLDPDIHSLLSDEDRSGLFDYTGEDGDQKDARHLGLTNNPCSAKGKKLFLLKVVVDTKSPGDNTFTVYLNNNVVMRKGPFEQAAQLRFGFCVSKGKLLRVEAEDKGKDGMRNGSYEVTLDGAVVARSPDSDKWSKLVHTFSTSSTPDTTDVSTSRPTRKPTPAPFSISGRNTCYEPRTSEEMDYLAEHNGRREKYHRAYGVDYKPLKWSNDLAKSSASYADKLLNYCCTSKLPHDSNNRGSFGENLASSCGSGSWGKKPAATNILNRWVENEHNRNYLGKLHYTQVLWRGTTHVGCGVAEKDMGNGYTCHMQVCRYQKPGNCGTNASNYKAKMLADSSGCGAVDVDC